MASVALKISCNSFPVSTSLLVVVVAMSGLDQSFSFQCPKGLCGEVLAILMPIGLRHVVIITAMP